MGLITRVEQVAAGWMAWVSVGDNNCVMTFFDHEPTEAEAQATLLAYQEQALAAATPQAAVNVYEYAPEIEASAEYVRVTPNLTLAKWNTYLGTLTIDRATAVRWFIIRVAMTLASRGELSISTLTETEVLSRMKTRLVSAPAWKIRRVFFGR
jgi:hypothetical protein